MNINTFWEYSYVESNFSIKRLIEEIKNAKWEVRQLDELVSKFIFGDLKINKSRENDGDSPSIILEDIFKLFPYIDIKECKHFVNEKSIAKKTYAEYGDVLIAHSGYTPNNSTGVCWYNSKEKALAGCSIYVLKHNQNPKYLSFALSSDDAYLQKKDNFKAGLTSLKSFYLTDIKKLRIPITSLELQEKIGNCLFKFSELERKLQKELEHRKKQHKYYRELIFDEIFKTIENR